MKFSTWELVPDITDLVSFRKFFFKIKILIKMGIRIRIMILLWISTPDLHFRHRRHPPNFVWIRQLFRKLLCQTQTEFFFCLFSLLRYTKHEHLLKGENFFFTHSITILSFFAYSVCDEKVKIFGWNSIHRGFRGRWCYN